MNVTLVLLFGTVGILAALLVYALRRPARDQRLSEEIEGIADPARAHATYFPVIRQAMSAHAMTSIHARSAGSSPGTRVVKRRGPRPPP